MIVYIAKNLFNEKIYIGQTKNKLIERIRNHKCSTNNKNGYFQRALKRYGFNNFKWEILEICQTIEELNKKEIYWINELKSNNRKIGYNLNGGGNNKKEISETTKRKIGKHSSKRNKGCNNPMFGKTHNEEIRKKISIKMSNKNHYRWKNIDINKIIELYKEHKNIKKISNLININEKVIRNRLIQNGIYKSFRKTNIKEIDINKLIELHKIKLSFYKISKILNIHHTTVKKRLENLNLL